MPPRPLRTAEGSPLGAIASALAPCGGDSSRISRDSCELLNGSEFFERPRKKRRFFSFHEAARGSPRARTSAVRADALPPPAHHPTRFNEAPGLRSPPRARPRRRGRRHRVRGNARRLRRPFFGFFLRAARLDDDDGDDVVVRARAADGGDLARSRDVAEHPSTRRDRRRRRPPAHRARVVRRGARERRQLLRVLHDLPQGRRRPGGRLRFAVAARSHPRRRRARAHLARVRREGSVLRGGHAERARERGGRPRVDADAARDDVARVPEGRLRRVRRDGRRATRAVSAAA